MFSRRFILVLFSSVTLLGSAGMHTVSEWMGTCSHHHGHSHSHDHCCSHEGHGHHHHHANHDDVANAAEPSSGNSVPENNPSQHDSKKHDSENCVVCIHYSLLAKSTSCVELPSLIDQVDQAPLPAYEGWVVNTIDAFDRRGPPAVA